MTKHAFKFAAVLLILGALLGWFIQPALAVTYRFSIPQSTADVYANEDGTVSIDYYYKFANDPSADPIDIVDVGMPTNNYDMGSITATINGQAATGIFESQYVKPGVEIHLPTNQFIMPGQSGELKVHIGKIERMLFNAKTKESEAYASFQFQPNF